MHWYRQDMEVGNPRCAKHKAKTHAGGSCSPLCWPSRIPENTQKLQKHFYWLDHTLEIRDFVLSCEICQQEKSVLEMATEFLNAVRVRPWFF